MDQKAVIFVAGMHRSGTSAVASAIEKFGFYPGPDLLPPSVSNQQGYYEDRAVNALNDEVLAQLNLTWWDAVLDPWVSQHGVETPLADKARHLLFSYLDDNPKLLLKDPRFCITAPFWLSILDSVGVKYSWLFVYREPSQIIGSLAKRDGFLPSHISLLTYSYWISALKYLPACSRQILRFEGFAGAPFHSIVRVLDNSGIEYGSASESEVGATLKEELIHSHEADTTDPRNPHLHNLLQLYEQLVEYGDSAHFSGLIKGLVADWQKISQLNFFAHQILPPKWAPENLPIRFQAVKEKRDQEVGFRLQQLIASHTQERDELRALLSSSNQERDELRALLSSSNQEREELRALLSSSNQEREELRVRFNALRESWSWRASAPIRFVLKPVFAFFSHFRGEQ